MNTPLRYAICNETFDGWPRAKACDSAAAAGYTGLEVAPFTLAGLATEITTAQRGDTRRTIACAGLDCVGLDWLLAKTEGFHVAHPEAAVRSRTVEYLGELARLCQDLGGCALVFGAPKQRSLLPGVTAEQSLDRIHELFSRLVPVLETTDTVVALEPLSAAETDVLTTGVETWGLIERIDSPRVRLQLDLKAMSSEAEPISDVMLACARHREHFHANDPNLQGPGFGAVDFKALDEVRYSGWVSMEVFDYAPGSERLARESVDSTHRVGAALG